MKTDITRQSLSLILLQIVLLLGIFVGRYVTHPDKTELPTGSLVNLNAIDCNTVVYENNSEIIGKSLSISGTMPLEGIIDSLAVSFPAIGLILVVIIIILNAFIITRFMTNNLMTQARNYLPSLCYIIPCCAVFFPGANLSAVLASLLLVTAFNKFVDSFSHRYNFDIIFKGSLLIGTAPLLYAKSVIFILLIPIAMRMFKRSGRERLVALFGVLLPTFAFAYLIWALGGSFSEIYVRLWKLTTAERAALFDSKSIDIARLTMIGIMSLTILAAIVNLISAIDIRTKARKVYGFALWMLLVSIGGLFLPSSSVADVPIIAIPIAYLAPLFFIRNKGRIPLTFYLATIIAAIILNTVPFI